MCLRCPTRCCIPDLVAAIKGEPAEVFATFDPVPLAAASIAQVHRATLKDGTPVVVKIRRPGIEGVIRADLRILEHAAKLLESEVPDSRRYDPVQIVSQFRRSLNRELDLAKEARNIDQFARDFADDPLVKIPRVYWEFTNDRVNVQEEIIGMEGVAPDKLRASGLDPKLLASRGADTVLRMVLEHGYFHADPHPGNVLFLPGQPHRHDRLRHGGHADHIRAATRSSTCCMPCRARTNRACCRCCSTGAANR